MDQKIFKNSMKISAEASCNFARWTCVIFVDFSVVSKMTKLVAIMALHGPHFNAKRVFCLK